MVSVVYYYLGEKMTHVMIKAAFFYSGASAAAVVL